MGERRIEVNLADFSVAVIEGDRVIHQARVVVGKPETPTPIFSDVMRYVLINPSWQVPDSIIKKEMVSKLGAFSRRGYEVKTVGGRVTVRQLPGDDNALGRFAFMFPNDHAIYLHDTPSKAAVRRGNPRLQPRLHSRRRSAEPRRTRARRRINRMDG